MDNITINPCKICGKTPEVYVFKPIMEKPIVSAIECCEAQLFFQHKRNPIYKYVYIGKVVETLYLDTEDSPPYAQALLAAEWNKINPKQSSPFLPDFYNNGD